MKKNTGNVVGDEVVQLYITHLVSSVTTPVIQLRGFQRVNFAVGEKQTLTFAIDAQVQR